MNMSDVKQEIEQIEDAVVTEEQTERQIEEQKIYDRIVEFGRSFKGMSREDFLKEYEDIVFNDAIFQLKFHLPRVEFKESLSEATPEKVKNILGNLGYVASQNPVDGLWSVTVLLGDDVVVIRDRNETNALLRAVITRHTETVYKRNDLTYTMVHYYMKANNLPAEENPLKFSKAEMEAIERNFKTVEGIDLGQFSKEVEDDLEVKKAEFEKRKAEAEGKLNLN